eukprot:307211_1
MPRKKKTKSKIDYITPIPDFSKDDLIDTENTKRHFPRKRLLCWKSKETNKDRMFGWLCKDKVSGSRCLTFDERNTKEKLVKLDNGNHHAEHQKHEKPYYKKASKFIYRECKVYKNDDGKKVYCGVMWCLGGEVKHLKRQLSLAFPSLVGQPKPPKRARIEANNNANAQPFKHLIPSPIDANNNANAQPFTHPISSPIEAHNNANNTLITSPIEYPSKHPIPIDQSHTNDIDDDDVNDNDDDDVMVYPTQMGVPYAPRPCKSQEMTQMQAVIKMQQQMKREMIQMQAMIQSQSRVINELKPLALKKKKAPSTKHQTTLPFAKLTTPNTNNNTGQPSVQLVDDFSEAMRKLQDEFKMDWSIDMNRLEGLPLRECLEILDHVLVIKKRATEIVIYCVMCMSFYNCHASSQRKLCCPKHGFKATEEDLDSYEKGREFIKIFKYHYSKHDDAAARFKQWDVRNRVLTFLQVQDAHNMVRANHSYGQLEVQESVRDSVGLAGNTNQSKNRITVIRKCLYQTVKCNFITSMASPTCVVIHAQINCYSVMLDTYSITSSKGEMVNIVRRVNYRRSAVYIKWFKWLYTEEKNVIHDREKIGFAYKALECMGCNQSNVSEAIENGGIIKIIVCISGDGKYHDAPEHLNWHLREHQQQELYQSVVSKNGFDDPIHENENANKTALKGNTVLISAFKLCKKNSKTLRYPKSTDLRNEKKRMRKKRGIKGGLIFHLAPDQRYMTHSNKQYTVYHEDFEDVVCIMRRVGMKSREAVCSLQFVLPITAQLDFLSGAVLRTLNGCQRTQSYRGHIIIADELAFTYAQTVSEDYRRFTQFAQEFEASKNMNWIDCFVESIESLPRIKAMFAGLCKTGMWKERHIGYKEEIQSMIKRKYGVRARDTAQTDSFTKQYREYQSIVFNQQYLNPLIDHLNIEEVKEDEKDEEDEDEESEYYSDSLFDGDSECVSEQEGSSSPYEGDTDDDDDEESSSESEEAVQLPPNAPNAAPAPPQNSSSDDDAPLMALIARAPARAPQVSDEDSSSDDDVPLNARAPARAPQVSDEDSSSDDDVPLNARAPARAPQVSDEDEDPPSSDDDEPLLPRSNRRNPQSIEEPNAPERVSPLSQPTASIEASNVVYQRTCMAIATLHHSFTYFEKYFTDLWVNRRKLKVERESMYEGLWRDLHFPTIVYEICQLDHLDGSMEATDMDRVLSLGNCAIETIYTKLKDKSRSKNEAISFLFVADPMRVREQWIRIKQYIIHYIHYTACGKEIRDKYPSLHNQQKHIEYEPYLEQIERRMTNDLAKDCNDFLIVWQLFQSQSRESSFGCEPIGCYLKRFHRKTVGAAKKIESVDESVAIVLHGTREQSAMKAINKGVTNHLVDSGRGVLKKNGSHHEARQIHSKQGKVVKRQHKGITTKYSVPMTMTAEQIRRNLNMKK